MLSTKFEFIGHIVSEETIFEYIFFLFLTVAGANTLNMVYYLKF